MAKEPVIDAFWVKGVNSAVDPAFLGQGEFSWGVNIDNTSGYIQTRQGYSRITGLSQEFSEGQLPRGMTVFTSKGGIPSIIICRGNQLLHLPYPFEGFYKVLPGASFRDTKGPVTFTTCIKSKKMNYETGEVIAVDPYPILIIQDGEGRAMVWDGTTLAESYNTDENPGIPIGLWGQWSGNRYWVAQGNKLRASDLADPQTFTEEDEVDAGGYFTLPDNITGIGQTPDFRSLLVFTDSTTTSFQSGIFERAQWNDTIDFQKLIYPGIGCAAGKSIVNQYGMTWWYSHQGLMGLNQAIYTYRDSRLFLKDQQMIRSKGNLSPDISGICCGAFGNYLTVSVPSGDGDNAHTWVFNQSILSTSEQNPSEWMGVWTGTRPVEWVTAVVKGQNRCFFFSKDWGEGDRDYYTDVYEAFIGDRIDVNVLKLQKIQSSFETRMLAVSPDFKQWEYAEVDLAEISGTVNLKIYVAGMRGGYKLIHDKDIVSSPGSANGPTQVTANAIVVSRLGTELTVDSTEGFLDEGAVYHNGRRFVYTSKDATKFYGFVGDYGHFTNGGQVTQVMFVYDPEGDTSTLIESWRPQRRTIRTYQVQSSLDDCSSCAVESNKNDLIDRGFSLLFRWTGKMAITGIRAYTEVKKDYQVGACEEDEDSARYVTQAGCGAIVDGVTQVDAYTFGPLYSKFLPAITPKHNEEFYTSRIQY